MNILDLAGNLGLSPRRCSSTNGGEYKSSCPKCQVGNDRFCIWPYEGTSGRYWCRVCGVSGDALEFCKDFLGMTYQQACQKLNIVPPSRTYLPQTKSTFMPHQSAPVPLDWQERAKRFIAFAHDNLMKEPLHLRQLEERGFNLETIKQFSLGWNPKTIFDHRERWGLSSETKDTGELRKQWLPKGYVIPSLHGSDPLKIKIRRSDWHQEDALPKYVEIAGSKQAPSIYGDPTGPLIIVESELDALLIQQEASHLVCSIALGGVSKKPDLELHNLLVKAPLILLSLDFDTPGQKRNVFWMKHYPNLRPWPAPNSKSPGDFSKKSPKNLLKWINLGLHGC